MSARQFVRVETLRTDYSKTRRCGEPGFRGTHEGIQRTQTLAKPTREQNKGKRTVNAGDNLERKVRALPDSGLSRPLSARRPEEFTACEGEKRKHQRKSTKMENQDVYLKNTEYTGRYSTFGEKDENALNVWNRPPYLASIADWKEINKMHVIIYIRDCKNYLR